MLPEKANEWERGDSYTFPTSTFLSQFSRVGVPILHHQPLWQAKKEEKVFGSKGGGGGLNPLSPPRTHLVLYMYTYYKRPFPTFSFLTLFKSWFQDHKSNQYSYIYRISR